ncbi:hypothetical protein HORIV_37940 [Vreelandella olivaria]|uniref:Uncharacterized protein n=1 Tax=Vreelandella olivaria TaxID=390919 RepID=A0ABN5X2Q2_9GAMM|nr:hypothetical protein HORIV_37940 [Halomonas olivaria]
MRRITPRNSSNINTRLATSRTKEDTKHGAQRFKIYCRVRMVRVACSTGSPAVPMAAYKLFDFKKFKHAKPSTKGRFNGFHQPFLHIRVIA